MEDELLIKNVSSCAILPPGTVHPAGIQVVQLFRKVHGIQERLFPVHVHLAGDEKKNSSFQ